MGLDFSTQAPVRNIIPTYTVFADAAFSGIKNAKPVVPGSAVTTFSRTGFRFQPIFRIRSMILSRIKALKGLSGSAEGAAPSFRNIIVQGFSSVQASH